MPIKHLVISGGGTIGFQFLGILEELNNRNFWKLEDIESIYATSVGSFLATIVCLNYDWETVNNYIINRPWHDIFKLSGKQIIEAYYNKGLYDNKIIETALKPLLEAKDLSLKITLKEFYEYSKIDLHIFTFELNTFKTVNLSHDLNPDMLLVDAISRSCAIPGVFMPICVENECFIDGGVMANYPLSFCLQDHPVKEEILGLNYTICKSDPKSEHMENNEHATRNANIITKDSSILDFILRFSMNAMNFITNSIPSEPIPHEIVCKIEESPMFLKESIYSSEKRKVLIETGIHLLEKGGPQKWLKTDDKTLTSLESTFPKG
uniref:PNPLA domain-containing protein n=1 Tax=viral metagenome TaxID=1070528 RepID=A0A6C0E2M0_9ZZZZ